VLPHVPDQDGRISKPPNLVGRERAIATLRRSAPGRVAFYWPENPDGVPVYVHAKVCVIDDQWASVGSDNFNRRSWTHDSEVSAAVCDPGYARALRLSLAREHLDIPGPLTTRKTRTRTTMTRRTSTTRWRRSPRSPTPPHGSNTGMTVGAGVPGRRVGCAS